jgi:hypothetical protein
MPAKPGSTTVGRATRTCVTEGCARVHLATDDAYCGACGTATVAARTT